jgi:single-stranded-DNA-specific exonuclease
MEWLKKEVSPELVKSISKAYSCDLLTASIFARRGITEGEDILYYLEDDLRYQHSPFLFARMEDAVDRIIHAKEEGEKVLVSGDKDVDGITSTALLVAELRSMGIDVSWKVPVGDDAYGLTLEKVEKFAADYGTLIITVDCGISNNKEIARACELGIDVIVTDHHDIPSESEALPSLSDLCIILNPKMGDYVFKNISGCAVVYKLVSALRFSRHDFYKQEICLLNVRPLVDNSWSIECLKIVNGINVGTLNETIVSGVLSFSQTRLGTFLRGQQIFVWDAQLQTRQLQKIFGTGIEFNLYDIRNDIAKVIPSSSGLSLLKLKEISRIAKYQETPVTELDCFYNLFVTFMQKQLSLAFPQTVKQDAYDLQLVALSTLSDIMPLKNENRIFVKQGLKSINAKDVRPGLLELIVQLGLTQKRIGSTEISWNITPVINAAGRLGDAALAVELFMNENPAKRTEIAKQIAGLNEQRKILGDEAWDAMHIQAADSVEIYNKNLCVVIDTENLIHRGVSGILASRLMQTHKVPAIVVTMAETIHGVAVGSLRTTRGLNATEFLDNFSDLFISYGGHNAAAGFSFEQSKTEEFIERLKVLSRTIELENADERLIIDAEIPFDFMTPDLLKRVDAFEPYGMDNPELRFLVKKAKIITANIVGNTEKKHLKLTLQCGKYKWPAIYWRAADLLGNDFSLNDTIDAVFTVSRNTFNGTETTQMIITDIKRGNKEV